MKKLFVTVPVLLLCGCALFQRGSKTEFNTLASAEYTVNSAATAYFDGVSLRKIPTNNVPTTGHCRSFR
jgi:hypothetical protein